MVWTPSRIVVAAITAGVVAVGVGAGVLLQPDRDRSAPADRGPGVNIAVVAPREPVPEPGSVMDVGELADGYSHSDYALRPADDRWRADVFEDEPPARVEPEPVERSRVIESRPDPAPAPVIVERRQPPPERRWPFGFDQPRPDYAAERRERQARLDVERRRENERRFEEARRADRFDERPALPEPREDRAREGYPDSDSGSRERQWYTSDGRPVPGPDRWD